MVSSILIKYKSFSNRSIYFIGRTITNSTTLDQNRIGSNGNEEVLQISQISRTGVPSPNTSSCHTQDTHFRGVLPLCRKYSRRILNPVDKAVHNGKSKQVCENWIRK